MSDAPGGPASPFDSFAGRLGKAAKKTSKPAPTEPPPPAPTPLADGAPIDSATAPKSGPIEAVSSGPQQPGQETKPPSGAPGADGASPFDSFAKRLTKRRKEAVVTSPAGDESAVAAPPPESAGPVGSGEHRVKQGECISSIAENAGHFWETIWNDAANAELRQARQDPNVLLPEDRVHVPALREKWEPRQTELRHRFRRRGWPEVLRFRVLRDDEPRGNQPYTLVVDGRETTGITDANGNLSQPIEPNARRAVLHVGTEPDVDRYEFTLGAIDPIDALSGVQGRLKNLGFDCGPIDGVWGPRSEAALRQYQIKRGLESTGRPDDPTRQKLKEDYGS
jgi:hypothetical protein